MAPTPPTREPTQFVAGDTVLWSRTLTNYPPADGWALHYTIVGPSAPSTQPTIVVTAGVYNVTLAATATADAAFVAGTYRMIGYVDGVNSERHTVFEGFVEVLPNFAAVTYANLKTHEEKMLAAIQAALEGRTTGDIEEYTIDGTQVKKMPSDRLLQLQGIYKAKIWRQQNPGKAFPNNVGRFVAAGSGVNADAATDWPGWQP